MISIRLAKPSEFDGAKDFIRSIFPAAMVRINDDDAVLLADYKGRIVGFAHLVDDSERIIVQGLGVDESMRGQGVGTLLLEHLLDMVRDDSRPLYLKVKPMNPALDLYARYGFFLKRFGRSHVLVRRHNS